jgi:hypothetical protein
MIIAHIGCIHAIWMVSCSRLSLRRSEGATHVGTAGGLVLLSLFRGLEHEVKRGGFRLRMHGRIATAVFRRSCLRFGGEIRAVAISLQRWNEICVWGRLGEKFGHRERGGRRRRMESWPCVGGAFLYLWRGHTGVSRCASIAVRISIVLMSIVVSVVNGG